MPAIIAAGLLAFTFSFDDVVTSVFLQGTADSPLPVVILGMIRFRITPEINAIGLLVMLFTVTLMSFAVIVYATAGSLGRSGRRGNDAGYVPMTEAAVDIVGVEKRFGELVAVRHLDLRIEPGEFFSIIGPSGCGKTTTLRMVAGFEDPDRRRISVGGRDMTGVRPYRRPVNTVFQSYALFPHLDVFENVAFGLREARVAKAEVRTRVGEAIEPRAARGPGALAPAQLSGGQQQRVALARALVNRPEVLLLDEPLGALDLKLRTDMQSQLKDLQRTVGVTFCYVTHDQGEAFSMSDRVAVMNQGLLEQVGTPEDIYHRPASVFVADFVGTANRFPGQVESGQTAGTYRSRSRGSAPAPCRGRPASRTAPM